MGKEVVLVHVKIVGRNMVCGGGRDRVKHKLEWHLESANLRRSRASRRRGGILYQISTKIRQG